MKFKAILLSTLCCFNICACGGSGSSSDSGTLISGTLTEAGGAAHSKSFALKHASGQKIENVDICALGECSTTDVEGQWGFVAPDNFTGGEVLFVINGHGIATTSTINIPADASTVFLDLQHVEGGIVETHHITVDGEELHLEPDGHENENEEEHEHD